MHVASEERLQALEGEVKPPCSRKAHCDGVAFHFALRQSTSDAAGEPTILQFMEKRVACRKHFTKNNIQAIHHALDKAV